MLLSDDPYASTSPVRFFTRELYLPTLAVGRLVETPAQIQRQIAAFQSAGGLLNPKTSLTTGYDFLSDGARAIDDELDGWSGIANSTLMGTSSESRRPPGSTEAHYDAARDRVDQRTRRFLRVPARPR